MSDRTAYLAKLSTINISRRGFIRVATGAAAGVATSARAATSGGGSTDQPLDLTAVNALGVRLGNTVDLLGSNGILTLGVDGQYARSSATGASTSCSRVRA